MGEFSKSVGGVLPWVLAALLIAGQFFACFWGTDRLWPFNPILVYTHAPNLESYKAPILVAYKDKSEHDLVGLGWMGEHMERKLAGRIARSNEEEREYVLKSVGKFLEPNSDGFEGLRAYRLTFNILTGEVLEKELLAETRWKL